MVSIMNGPITTHPYYDKSNQNTFVDKPVARVRPEAQQIATKSMGTVGMLMVEGNRCGSASRRFKPEPKDHMRENIRRMRRIQRESRKKEEASVEKQEKPVKALWKSSKYEEVSSKVKDNLNKPAGTPRPHSANYLRAHSRTGFIPMSARSATPEPSEDDLSVPRAQTAREIKLIRRDIDFIKLNGKIAKKTTVKRAPSLTALDDLKQHQEEENQNYHRGAVPHYLKSRQDLWKKEADERRAALPDPELPEGHRLMPSKEKRETLEKLKQTQKDLQNQMCSLPIRTDTMRVKQQKAQLDKKLSEVEEAIKIFSREKVFVKLDE